MPTAPLAVQPSHLHFSVSPSLTSRSSRLPSRNRGAQALAAAEILALGLSIPDVLAELTRQIHGSVTKALIEGRSAGGSAQHDTRLHKAAGPLTSMPKSGMIVPILGAKAVSSRSRRKSLADALFTKTQQRVLGVLFGQPERSFYASELIRDAGTGSGAAQRELAKLEGSGLISARRIGSPALRLSQFPRIRISHWQGH